MFFRRFALLLTLVLAVGCGKKDDLKEPPVDLGDFALGHNIVYADKMKKVPPISRDATVEQWESAMTKAIEDRFGRYNESGTKFYNLGIAVDAYLLAPPGIPVVASPNSMMVITVSIFDDATGKLLNPEPRGTQMTVFDEGDGQDFADGILGSGLTQTAEEQMATLSKAAARKIEYWLRDNREWFGLPSKSKVNEKPPK